MQRSGTESQRHLRLINYGANLKSGCLDPRAGSFTLLQWFASCVPWSPAGTVLGCRCWEAPRKQCSIPRLSQAGCQAVVNLLDQPSLEVFPQGSISQWGEPSRLLKAGLSISHPQSWWCVCAPIPGILQARTLEWVAISFSNA